MNVAFPLLDWANENYIQDRCFSGGMIAVKSNAVPAAGMERLYASGLPTVASGLLGFDFVINGKFTLIDDLLFTLTVP